MQMALSWRLVALSLASGCAARSLRRGVLQVSNALTPREEACRFCFRECPINCFVGTCGMEYNYNVRRYKYTSQCYSCDASASVGINKVGDFSICGASEAAATVTYTSQQEETPPMGPGIPGDARAAAKASADAANAAAQNAQEAAAKAEEAEKAAVAKFQSVKKEEAAGGAEEKEQEANGHAMAMKIRAEELHKAMLASEKAMKISDDRYSQELYNLRKQQLLTDSAEEVAQRAHKAAEKVRADFTKFSAEAAQAAQEAAVAGAAAAASAAEEGAANEMVSAAQAAQRRAIAAAKAAKEAADKANLAQSISDLPAMPAPTIPPCNPSAALLLQNGMAAQHGKACEPPPPSRVVQSNSTGARSDAPPPAAQAPPRSAAASQDDVAQQHGLTEEAPPPPPEAADPAFALNSMDGGGEPPMSQMSEQIMSQQLAENLAQTIDSHPEAANGMQDEASQGGLPQLPMDPNSVPDLQQETMSST